jgi:hypothetical protein
MLVQDALRAHGVRPDNHWTSSIPSLYAFDSMKQHALSTLVRYHGYSLPQLVELT